MTVVSDRILSINDIQISVMQENLQYYSRNYTYEYIPWMIFKLYAKKKRSRLLHQNYFQLIVAYMDQQSRYDITCKNNIDHLPHVKLVIIIQASI